MEPSEIESCIAASMTAWGVPGSAVAVVQGEEAIYLKGHGVKEIGKEDSVTPDSLFAIASTTKAFTCTAIAMLVEEGRLKWDDLARKHLDYFRLSDSLADANVTLRDMVTHRTGMSRHDMLWYGSGLSREEILRRIGLVRPTTSFRSTWEYNNIMYLAAGTALGKAAGSSWESVIRERIFAPLGMTGANFSVSDLAHAPDFVAPHWKDRQGKTQIVPWRNLDNCAPGGSINAGARDMSKWLRFLVNGGEFEGKRLLSAELLRETHTPQMLVSRDAEARDASPHIHFQTYGLGWAIHDYFGHRVLSHGGGIDGFRSQVALIPEKRIGIAILSNKTPSLMPEALRDTLYDLALGLPAKDWDTVYRERMEKGQAKEEKERQERLEKRHADTRASRELAAYAGAYSHPAYGTAHITQENGALAFEWSWVRLPLERLHYDTFLLYSEAHPPIDETVTFALDEAGAVSRLTLFGQEFAKTTP
jgi:CubicO group peptidase (beta-lactamase class C family)